MPYITSVERIGIRQGLLEGIELGLDLKFGSSGLRLLPEISFLGSRLESFIWEWLREQESFARASAKACQK